MEGRNGGEEEGEGGGGGRELDVSLCEHRLGWLLTSMYCADSMSISTMSFPMLLDITLPAVKCMQLASN